jgi:hypothetical protein
MTTAMKHTAMANIGEVTPQVCAMQIASAQTEAVCALGIPPAPKIRSDTNFFV